MNELLVSAKRAVRLSSLDLEPHLDADGRTPLRAAAVTALLGLYLMAVGMGGFKALQNSGMALVVLGSLPFLPAMARRLRGDLLTWFVLAFLLFLLLRTVAATWEPEPPEVAHWDRARRMSRVILILLVAWWLGGRRDRAVWMLASVMLGLLAAMIWTWIEWGAIEPMFDGDRIQFRLNPQHMGLFSGIVAIGLVIFVRPLLTGLQTKFVLIASAMLWVLALGLMLQAFIVSQSRGAYLAVLCVAGALVISALWRFRHPDSRPAGKTVVFVLLATAVIVVSMVSQWDTFTQRFDAESAVIAQVASGEWEGLPFSSVGYRAYLLKAGVDAWLQRPYMGWGTDGAVQAIMRADVPEQVKQFNHFHNSYLDLLVRFGVIGTTIFLMIPFLMARAVIQDVTRGIMNKRMALFLLSALATFAFANLTESYLIPSHGWFFLALLGGAMFASRLWARGSQAVAWEAAGESGVKEVH